MTFFVTLFGDLGLAAVTRPGPARTAILEGLGGLLLVAGFIGLGFKLAQSAG